MTGSCEIPHPWRPGVVCQSTAETEVHATHRAMVGGRLVSWDNEAYAPPPWRRPAIVSEGDLIRLLRGER